MGIAKRRLAVVALTVIAGIVVMANGPHRGAAADPPADPPFALLELFTSEGCSSCPPADKILAQTIEDARRDGRRVFALAFHVDYWNRLGWEDRFSSPESSDRQTQYNKLLTGDSNYTPQMIVNGRVEFAADGKRLRAEIGDALNHRSAAHLAITAQTDVNKLDVAYEVAADMKQCILNLAAVERNLETKITRGENGKRTLRHENVVRAFRQIDLREDQSRGSANLALPADAKLADVTVIAFLQNRDSMEVLAAAEATPSPHTPHQ